MFYAVCFFCSLLYLKFLNLNLKFGVNARRNLSIVSIHVWEFLGDSFNVKKGGVFKILENWKILGCWKLKYEGNNQLANTSVSDSPSPQQSASELVSGLIGCNDLYTLYNPFFFHSQINPISPRTDRERERKRETAPLNTLQWQILLTVTRKGFFRDNTSQV